MQWPRIDGHTPGPFRGDSDDHTAALYTVGSPYGHGQMHIADIRGWGHLTGSGACKMEPKLAAEVQDATAELLCIIGPHLCDVPDCPGPKLVARLEAAEKMAVALRPFSRLALSRDHGTEAWDADVLSAREALAAYEAAK